MVSSVARAPVSPVRQFRQCASFASAPVLAVSQFRQCASFASAPVSPERQFCNSASFARAPVSPERQFRNSASLASAPVSPVRQFRQFCQFRQSASFASAPVSPVRQFRESASFASAPVSPVLPVRQFCQCASFARAPVSPERQFCECASLARAPVLPVSPERQFCNNARAPVRQFRNSAREIWKDLFLQILDKHAPLQSKKIKSKRSPWITSHIKHLIITRDNLKRKAIMTKLDTDWEMYKKARNETNTKLKQAKRDYFSTKISANKQNPKAAWKTINTLLGKHYQPSRVNELNVNDIKLTKPNDIAEGFNTFFSNIGPSLAEEIDTAERNSPFQEWQT